MNFGDIKVVVTKDFGVCVNLDSLIAKLEAIRNHNKKTGKRARADEDDRLVDMFKDCRRDAIAMIQKTTN